MRILLTADPELPVPPGDYGGIERLVAMWVEELRKMGHQVGLCAHRDSTAEVDFFAAWPGRASQDGPSTWQNTWALHRAAKSFRADVVHSSSRLIYTLPLLLRRLPTVMTYHRWPGIRQIRWAARIGGNHLRFTGVSSFIASVGGKGGGRWDVVPNCINLPAYRHHATVATDAPLVFLSRIERVKGVTQAISIARAAGRSLVIAGNHSADANARAYWENEVRPLIDDQSVRYVGTVNDVEKNELLGNAAGMLLPVQWDEPFGMVAAEALACGTPVIATPRGGLREIVQDGVNGFLCADHECAVKAIGRLTAIDRDACRKSAEQNYSPRSAANRFLAVYQRAISPSQNGH